MKPIDMENIRSRGWRITNEQRVKGLQLRIKKQRANAQTKKQRGKNFSYEAKKKKGFKPYKAMCFLRC